MDTPVHKQVREIEGLRPRLRNDLHFSFQDFGTDRCCIIEDPVSSRYHRVGLAEFQLMRLLDGRTPFAAAQAQAALESGPDALTEREAAHVLSWLVEMRLVDLGGEVPVDALDKADAREFHKQTWQRLNILSAKIPLGSPDRFLRRLGWLGLFFISPFFFAGWILVLAVGGAVILENRVDFARESAGILAPHNWLWLGVIWFVLKCWHELWHGLICQAHGGRVREAGLVLIVLMPLGYIDASSSLAFPSKWKRMHVSAAGMVGELFLAAIAACIWVQLPPGLARHIMLNTVIMGSAATLFFNLNPLMRFDGYYLLADWLEIPNLAKRSMSWMGYLVGRFVLGARELTAPPTGGHPVWIYICYGLLAALWRIFITLSLLLAASSLFRGGGLLFAVIAAAMLLVGMMTRLVQGAKQFRHTRFRPLAAGIRILLLVGGIAAVLFVPIHNSVRTQGVLQYAEEVVVRPELDGFIGPIWAWDGREVKKNDHIMTLSNHRSEAQLATLRLRQEAQRLRHRRFLLSGQAARAVAEKAAIDALADKITELESQLKTLTIHAEIDGVLMAPGIDDSFGTYIPKGSVLLRIADPTRLELTIPIAQSEADDYRSQLGKSVDMRVEGMPLELSGTFVRMTS